MKRINILDPQTAQLIAAGEITENPASVVKELVENSIDAGATRIIVEIRNGGVKSIKVSDNGHGIYRDDVKTAFERHATSKISSESEIERIVSLGFRGEALASICSVSKVELVTRSNEESVGSGISVWGGEYGDINDTGCPVGTTIHVKDLFYNTPARMKFLKKDVAEGNKVASVIDKLALSHPGIFFKFVRDGKQVLCTSGNGKISSAIYSVYGKDFFDGTLPVEYNLKAINVSGFVSKPEKCRASKSMQIFFINGRFIRSKVISNALEEAFKNSVMVGRHPYCAIYLKIPHELVDINVHPAKMEVRFANERDVFEAVYYAVKTSLMKRNDGIDKLVSKAKLPTYNPVSPVEESAHGAESPIIKENSFSSLSFRDSSSALNLETVKPLVYSYSKALTKNTPIKEEHFSEKKFAISEQKTVNEEMKCKADESPCRIIEQPIEKIYSPNRLQNKFKASIKILGEVFNCYIIVQVGEALLLVDKHAAHERIIFEKIKKQSSKHDSQILLKPLTVTLEKEEYSAVIDNLSLFSEAGYDVGDFGSGTVVVRSIPMYEDLDNLENSIVEIATYILKNKRNTETKKLDWIYHNIACRSAVKAGTKTSREEIISLLNEVFENPNLRYCPHGRPIYIEITKKFIEKQFGRT